MVEADVSAAAECNGVDAEIAAASSSCNSLTSATFEKGDLVMAKLKGHAWWPALITENPETSEIRRKRVHGFMEVHVLFLNDVVERGWVGETDKSLLRFTGVADFDRFKQQKLEEAEKKSKMAAKDVEKQFAVVARRLSSWTRGMRVADRLLAVANEHRQTSLEWAGKELSKQLIIKGDLLDESVAAEREQKRKPYKRRQSRVSTEPPSAKKRKTKADEDEARSSPVSKANNKQSMDNVDCVPEAVNGEVLDEDGCDELNELEGEKPDKDARITLCLEKVPACFICCQTVDKGESRRMCSGACKRVFHKTCADIAVSNSVKYLCKDCSEDGPACLLCSERGKEPVLKCSVAQCRRFYHERCVGEYRFADHTVEINNNSFQCPAHRCFTCFSYGRDVQASEGALLGCMLCPVSYHRNDDCIPAGCYLITDKWLVCPLHFKQHEANYTGDFHVNVDHCSDCQKSGVLICCDRCPAAFHKECLVEESTTSDDGEFLCTECKLGRFPMYNDIVWAKYGKYRWWPSVVVHPLEIPDRIDNLPHAYGEFVIRFLGTKEHAYITHGRVFSFREGDRPNTGAIGTSMRKSFAAGLEEAQKLLDDRKKYKERLEQEKNVERSNKIPEYRLLKQNHACAGVKKDTHALDEYPTCSCDPTGPTPCGGDDQCTNRAMQIECNDECMAGDRCGNKRFTKRQYAIAEPFYTGSRGWGLRSLSDIKKGTFVAEYMGELIGTAEFQRRWQQKLTDSDSGFYFLTLDKARVIDAEHAGNMSRFMNHSCEPNCDTFTWQVGNDIRVGLFTNRNLKPGEELTFHYNFDPLDADLKTECHCRTPSCCGFIMKKQSKPVANGHGSSAAKSKSSAKKKRTFRSEKYCYCCGDGGTLICCGKNKCPKVYHLECLKQETVPEGVWFCPWHYCNECGKKATRLCTRCEDSWCEKHFHGNFPTPIDFSKPLVCNEHSESASSQDLPSVSTELVETNNEAIA